MVKFEHFLPGYENYFFKFFTFIFTIFYTLSIAILHAKLLVFTRIMSSTQFYQPTGETQNLNGRIFLNLTSDYFIV